MAENLVSFEAFAREALLLVPAEGDVLDVAAGPGSLTLQAARTARHVHAVDFAPAMLEQLRGRAAAAGITNVEARIGDGQELPYPDASFDAAYSMFGLMFFPDRARGFRELVRVLRPGGRAVVSSWPPPERVAVFKALFEAMGAESPGPRPSGGGLPPALSTSQDITTEMTQAGFSRVEVHEHVVIPGTSTPAELWSSFARGGAPAVLMRKKMGDAAFAEFSQRVIARLEDALGSAPIEVRLLALLGVGTR